jgi:hypothetical protein
MSLNLVGGVQEIPYQEMSSGLASSSKRISTLAQIPARVHLQFTVAVVGNPRIGNPRTKPRKISEFVVKMSTSC